MSRRRWSSCRKRHGVIVAVSTAAVCLALDDAFRQQLGNPPDIAIGWRSPGDAADA